LAACDESDPLLDTDGSTACKFASRGITLVLLQLNQFGIQVFSIHPQINDLISHFLRISSDPSLAWMRRTGRSRAIWRTKWRTTCDDVIDGKHISLADGGWGQAAAL
jgi:hypothetical protein